MRVIGGEFRSRVLVAPPGSATRPTSDRLRETLFNVLGPRMSAARFADLYAGSGAVGVEALSRGASFCLFAERAAPALTALRKNLATLGLGGRARVETRPVLRALQEVAGRDRAFDVIFLDPPYEAVTEYTATLDLLGRTYSDLLAPGGVVIAEHARRSSLGERYGALKRQRVLEQGDAALSFYAVEATQPAEPVPEPEVL